jgi:hypothetical protein
MKTIFLILFTLIVQFSWAQTKASIHDAIKTIETITDVAALESKYPNWEINIKDIPPVGFFGDSIIGNSELHSVHEKHYTKTGIHFLAKVIKKEKQEFCRLSYILVQRKSMSSKELDKLQNEIISKYDRGSTILELVTEYNQDGNSTGELDWFSKGMMVPEFEKEVWNKDKGEVFKVNIPDRNWYYVVFKTHSNQTFDVSKCVKITICKNGCADQEHAEHDREASFPGGKEALSKFIKENYKPVKVKINNNKIENILISFTVESDGEIKDINATIGLSEEFNSRAIEVIKMMPNWNPKINGGIAVRSIERITFPLEINK